MDYLNSNGKVNTECTEKREITNDYLCVAESPTSNNGLSFQYWNDSDVSTYDSLRLTTPILGDFRLKNIDNWSFSGRKDQISQRKLILFKNQDGTLTDERTEQTVTTVGLTQNYKYGRFIVDVPSANTYLHRNPLQMLGSQEVGQFQDQLKQDLSQHIEFDLDHMDVSRFDSSALFQMENEASTYINLLTNCIPQKVRRRKKLAYSDQSVFFTTKNKSASVGFYDKIAKEKSKHYADLSMVESNLLRFESSTNKRAGVKHKMGQLKFHHLADERTISGIVIDRSKQFNNYFKLDNKATKKWSMDLQTTRILREEGASLIGMRLLAIEAIQQGSSIERTLSLMSNAGIPSNTIWRERKRLELLLSATNDVLDLYDEITMKINSDLKLVA